MNRPEGSSGPGALNLRDITRPDTIEIANLEAPTKFEAPTLRDIEPFLTPEQKARIIADLKRDLITSGVAKVVDDAGQPCPLNPSDLLQLAGVYDSNPVTGAPVPFLKHFMFVSMNEDGTMNLSPPCPGHRLEEVVWPILIFTSDGVVR